MSNLLTEFQENTNKLDKDFEFNFYKQTGFLEFFVIQNNKHVFEIEHVDLDGCIQSLIEDVGLEYLIEECFIGEGKQLLKQGHTYLFKNINVFYMSGDGWEIEDDEEWSSDDIVEIKNLKRQITHNLYMLWFLSFGFRIRNIFTKVKLYQKRRKYL